MNLLATWLTRAAARHPEAVALVDADGAHSYRSLLDRATLLAGRLQGRGPRPLPVAAVQTASAQALAWSAHAASLLGCALLPLNPALSTGRRDALLQLAGARDATGIMLDALADEGEDGNTAPAPWTENGIELLIATSGTQGEPKAVMLSGANLQAATLASRNRLPLATGDAWLVCLPLYHIGGMAILYRCAEAGATAVLHQGFDPLRVWQDLEKCRVSHISLVPAMLARLLDAACEAPPPATLKYALVGGGPLSAALALRARLAGWPVCASYGMSETGSQVATLCDVPNGHGESLFHNSERRFAMTVPLTPSPLPQAGEGDEVSLRESYVKDLAPGQVGLPLEGFEVEIVGEDGRPTPGTGRIRIRGNAVMAGYANPQRRPGMGLEQGWFLSGDLGRLDQQGRLTVLGRHDDMLVSGGVNVHPQAVEEVLQRCPGVADAALTAVADEIWGDLLVALVAGEASDEALEKWCREKLPGAMRPRRFVRVERLPRNALGKLERQALSGLVRHY